MCDCCCRKRHRQRSVCQIKARSELNFTLMATQALKSSSLRAAFCLLELSFELKYGMH